MSRTNRTRNMVRPRPAGSLDGLKNGTVVHDVNSGNEWSQVMHDQIGRPVVDSPMDITKEDRSGLIPINGGFGVEGIDPWGRAVNYVSAGLRNNPIGPAAFTGCPAANVAMADLIARTNPSRPDYVPLTLLQDLVEIPKQLAGVKKLLGKVNPHEWWSAKDMANQHLGIQFGWLPLIQDVKDLLDLQKHIHKRMGEVQRLYQSGGLKRRIFMGRWVGSSKVNWAVSSNLVLKHFTDLENISIRERWGTVRWKPSVPLPWYDPLYLFNEHGSKFRPNDAEIIDKSRRVVSGWTSEGLSQGTWDLIPWTWITDWFENVGSFALQYSNTIPATPSQACIMTETDVYIRLTPTLLTVGFTGGGGFMTQHIKERYVGPASLNAHLPFIDGRRLSILSALFVQRFKGSGRF